MEDHKSGKSSLQPADKKPIGQILIEAGLISISQLELALQEQKQNSMRVGELLVAHGWISPQTIDFFGDRWWQLIEEKQKKPLVFYFQEAGLISAEQCQAIIKLQKLKRKKVRFHRLAIEQGYLKRSTVDFFLAHLFGVYDPQAISTAKPYELLKNYSQGQKDFSKINLAKAPLMNVSLREISLNGSNLRKADLSKAILTDSSLIQVNLSLANLSNAILTNVNLTRAFASRASFQKAHLEKANFQSAILHEVNFKDAYLAQVNFAGADLTKAMLPLDYPYTVYYDRYTILDRTFEPQVMGWTKISE